MGAVFRAIDPLIEREVALKTLLPDLPDAVESSQKFAVVHRDVKPANVMVAASGRCKLTDFGVAYVPSSTMTQTGAALGSPKYMSPEQVLGQKSDPRSDVFSLGSVLYEMLTGGSPFERPGDTSVFQIMNRIAGEPHPPLRSLEPQLPVGFERIVDRALAKRPEQRYQHAGDMAQERRKMQYTHTAYHKTLLARP